jgi:hypothetical protein
MIRVTVSFAILLALAGAAQAQALNDSAKRMVGAWEFSNADRDKTCSVTFKADKAGGAYKVEFDPKCGTDFPMVKDIAGWSYPDNDLLHLLDGKGKSVVDFSEVETGMFEAPTPGYGVLFLQSGDDVGAKPIPAEDVAGQWNIMRGGRGLCGLTLAMTPSPEEGFSLEVKPNCDTAVARLGFNRWRVDRDELQIFPARGNPWRFERSDDGKNWDRVPDTSNPYTLERE